MTRLPTISEIAMRQHTMNTLELVIDLPFLAREINDAHRQVIRAGKSILVEARRAGEALLDAKKHAPHGTFASWVEDNCEFSYRTAKRYMLVAKRAKLGPFDPAKSVDAFLKAQTEEEPEPSKPREFTREDAERALKFHALATRGATEGEQKAASAKLAGFAKEFGMTPEAAVAKAREFLPDAEKTEFERNAEERFHKAKAEWCARQAAREAEFEKENAAREARAKEQERRIYELQERVERMTARREVLFKSHQNRSREELLSRLVVAELRLEGFGA